MRSPSGSTRPSYRHWTNPATCCHRRKSWHPCPPSCRWPTHPPTQTRPPTRRCRTPLFGRRSTRPSSGWVRRDSARCESRSRWVYCSKTVPPTALMCCCCRPVCRCLPSCWSWMSPCTPPHSATSTIRSRVAAPRRTSPRTHFGWRKLVCPRRVVSRTSTLRFRLSLLFRINALSRVAVHCWLRPLTCCCLGIRLWLHLLLVHLGIYPFMLLIHLGEVIPPQFFQNLIGNFQIRYLMWF